MSRSNTQVAMEREIGVVAPNYYPLPVVISSGQGAWVTDVDGRSYLDALAGYSSLNFGHANGRLIDVAREQLERLTMTSRAFYNDQLGPFCADLAELTGQDMVLPMNTGAEAVETAIKAARKWGYEAKGVPADAAEIIVCDSNFHGRTTTIISFSDDEGARASFGPYTPGFVAVPFSDLDAVRAAINDNTVAVIVEPIQGEAGVMLPSDGYLQGLRRLCSEQNVLLVLDEVQSGFGRTGHTFAYQIYDVEPDLLILGKALGGGIVPVSAVVGRAEVIGLMTPGTHGSTFGGNPLGAAIGREVVQIMREGEMQRAAVERGGRLGRCLDQLRRDHPDVIKRISRQGLWAGIEFDPSFASGREVCEEMLERQVLLKDAHGSVVRVSPPLTVSEGDVAFLCDALRDTVRALSERD